MTMLVSITSIGSSSDEEGGSPIGFVLLHFHVVKQLAQFDAVEVQEARKLAFAQQVLLICLGCQQIEPERRWTVCFGLVPVRRSQIAKYLSDQYALADSYIPRREAQKFLENELVAIRRFVGAK